MRVILNIVFFSVLPTGYVLCCALTEHGALGDENSPPGTASEYVRTFWASVVRMGKKIFCFVCGQERWIRVDTKRRERASRNETVVKKQAV